MQIRFSIDREDFTANMSNPLEISIPMIFNGPQPNTYDVPDAVGIPYEHEGFIGDVRQGGGCNFEKYTIIPHCNGTHTECIGHISFERIPVNKTLKDLLIPAMVITVEVIKGEETDDNYIPDKEDGDYLITKKWIEFFLKDDNKKFAKALVIRTMPNDDSKKSRRYMENQPPFFSLDAMEYIKQMGVEHLLVDIPSVDRTFDEGKLSTHHIFWGVEFGSHDIDKDNHSMKTITEMIYVPNEIPDGNYLVSIQIPDFKTDAAPSRVFLYNIEK